MTWRRSKLFFLSLAVLLCLSSALSAEVCLTDAEFQELSDNLTLLDQTLTEQSQLIELQGTQLATAQTLIKESEKQIQQAEISYNAALKYYKRQRREVGILGSILGLIVGTVTTIIVVLAS